MKPLRIALGLVAALLLAAAAVASVMSVTINWQFARTLGANPTWSFYLALTYAAVEVARIGMPFLARGLKMAGMRPRMAHLAFVLFTALSVTSAASFFQLNRSDASAARGLQMSETRGYKAELASINKRLEKEIARSAGEVEAELKPMGKYDPRRPPLEAELAAIAQRDKDLARLDDLRGLKVWSTAVASADVQVEAFGAWAVTASIVAAVVAIELLVGFTPYAAIMVLVWAFTPAPVPVAATGEPSAVKVPPDDHVQRFLAGCIARGDNYATQWKQLYGGYTKFCAAKGWQPLNEFRMRPALQAALGGKPIAELTEKRKQGIFWLTLALKPAWLPEEAPRAAA